MLHKIDYDAIINRNDLILDKDINNLTLPEIREELRKITDVESKTGFLYFCLNYIKVSHPTRGAVPLKNEMYLWQKKAAIDFLTYENIISYKVRQTGFSAVAGSYALYRTLFFPTQEVNVFSKTGRDSTIFLSKRIKFPYDNLPVWLKQKASEFAKTSVTFDHNKSHLMSLPQGGGRGDSISLAIADEFAFYKDADGFMADVGPAMSAGYGTKFSNKTLPPQMILISTLPHVPIGNKYLDILNEARENPEDSSFHVVEVDTSDIPHYQSEDWHKQQRATLGERLYNIEVKGQIQSSAENSFFTQACLNKLETAKVLRTDFLFSDQVNEFGEPIDLNQLLTFKDNFDKSYGYIKGLFIYKDVVPEKQYCVIADLATGRGSDFSVIHVFNLENYEQVAEYRNKVDLESFKHIIHMIALYYNQAKLSTESTGLGESIAQYFYDTLSYENFYVHQQTKNKFSPGFPMNNNTRPNALAIMQTMLEKGEVIINGLRTINELKMFGYSGNKIQGLEGSNDDLVMSLAQFCYLTQNGFAASDSAVMNNLLYGEMIAEREKEEEEVKAMHYLNKRNDIVIEPETEKYLRMMRSLGFDISEEELNKMAR